MSQNPGLLPSETITIRDYLQNMLKEENISLKILEKTQAKTCTYSKGAINQTIFGCKTCSFVNQPAGFCFGCYLACHLDHETFEIGLKRDFLCECGTTRLQNECCLQNDKFRDYENKYDHNFLGRFCECDQEYDPNLSVNEFMISCLICSDFYHVQHLSLSEKEIAIVKENEGFSIMVCPKCLRNEKTSFFMAYVNDKDVSLPISSDEDADIPSEKKAVEEKKESAGKRKEGFQCPLERLDEEKIAGILYEKPVFLRDNWFDNLCLCEKCLKIYKGLDLEKVYKLKDENEIIIEEEDVEEKENENNSNKPKALYEESLTEFSKLDFITQSNIANLYREFYSEFIEFSRPFVEKNEIITKNHINTFFEQLNKKKRNTEGFN